MQNQRAGATKTTEATVQRSRTAEARLSVDAPAHPIVELQQTIGNQAVQRLLRSRMLQAKLSVSQPGDPFEQEADRVADQVMRMPDSDIAVAASPSSGMFALQRKCACGDHTMAGGECSECSEKKRLGLQTKLKVNDPGDIYEQEADRIADQVMAAPVHHAVGGAPPLIQRFSGQSNGKMDAVPASVDQALASPGRPLEPALRRDMEQRFGHDFSRVRVHTDAKAAESARVVDALAYTVGRDIVFGAERYAPGTSFGQHLLAHELTHVIQQGGRPIPSTSNLGANQPDLGEEREAETAAQSAMNGYETPRISISVAKDRVQRAGFGELHEAESRSAGSSCGPDTTDWFVGIMNSAKSDRNVLEIQRRLGGARKLGARYGYSATNVLEGGVVRKVLAAEAAAGHPARTKEASRQIAAADPHNEFGRAVLAATGPIVGAPELFMLAAIRGASLIWKSLVQTGAVWDFKNNVLSGASLSAAGCPSMCSDPPTITLCGTCYEHDLPGNLFYAYIGRVCGFSLNALQLGSQYAELLPTSSGGWDPPEDTAAINLGFGLPTTLTKGNLCAALGSAGTSLVNRSCTVCPKTYSP